MLALKDKYPQNGKWRDVSLKWRFAARGGAVALLAVTIFYGLTAGGYVTDPDSPLYNLSGRFAAKFGNAAQQIRISGLKRKTPASVLNIIGVKPNDSLIGFDPLTARRILQNFDWVKSAQVRKVYPNQLEIEVEEREPFAIWQRDGEFYVIDKSGSAFTSVAASDVPGMLVITGDGANEKVFQLVNHIEAHLQVKSKVKAASYVGGRRWNLYLANGIKVMLPEGRVVEGLKRFSRFYAKAGLEGKQVNVVDLRLSKQIVVSPVTGSSGRFKISAR